MQIFSAAIFPLSFSGHFIDWARLLRCRVELLPKTDQLLMWRQVNEEKRLRKTTSCLMMSLIFICVYLTQFLYECAYVTARTSVRIF